LAQAAYFTRYRVPSRFKIHVKTIHFVLQALPAPTRSPAGKSGAERDSVVL
jgi:hypothetical protein